jgi:putative endonuclease
MSQSRTIVIPGRCEASSPESITTNARDGLLRLSPCEQETRHALPRRDKRYRAAGVRAPDQGGSGLYETIRVDKLVWFEIYDDALTAIAREKELKKWRRDWKIRLIEEQNPGWEDLYPGISN